MQAQLTLSETTTVREVETLYNFGEREKITDSQKAETILRPFFTDIDEVESFHVLVLSRANEVIAHKLCGLGGLSGCVADPKVIFRYALSVKGAAGIMVAHNHPSGNLKASAADIGLTKKLKDGGNLLEMPVLDHLILSPNNKYFSFADEGML